MPGFVSQVVSEVDSLDEPLAPPEVKPEDIEIQYVDSRTPEDKRFENNTVDYDATEFTEADKQRYGSEVRKRMGQMSYRIKQAERERDQAMRDRQALEQHTQGLQVRLKDLEGQQQKLGGVALEATRNRIEQEISSVKAEIAALLTSAAPDASKVVDAQEKLSALVSHRQQMYQLAQQQASEPPAPSSSPQGAGYPGSPQAAGGGYPAVPTYYQDRERWLAMNSAWFGKDQPRTNALVAIEQELVKNGVIMGSPAYWNAVERAKERIMNHNGTNGSGSGSSRPSAGQAQTPKSIVTGTNRASSGSPLASNGRRVVQLSEVERRVAARLNVPESDYAAEKAKIEDRKRALGEY